VPYRQHERDEQVERRLLGHADERGEQDVPPLQADDLGEGTLHDRLALLDLGELGALHDP
jgi:hypothetical protein